MLVVSVVNNLETSLLRYHGLSTYIFSGNSERPQKTSFGTAHKIYLLLSSTQLNKAYRKEDAGYGLESLFRKITRQTSAP